ncbi:MAG TPA: hypothetical protein VF589_07300, partial [Allosphingosinicella sp.]
IDICYAVGYNSLGSFNNRFVSLVGCSPRRIRSLAARVDPAELRRLIDGRAAIASPDAPDACSIWGTTSVTSGFSGVAVVALFLGPPSNAYPVASALCEGGAYLLPPVPEDSDYFVMAVGLSWHEQMVDFLLQPNPLQAAALPPIHLSASGMASPIHFHLAPRQPIDAPIPPSLALRLVEQFMRLPEELPKHRVRPSQRVLGLAAAPPRPSHRPAPYDSRVAGPISLTPAE